MNISTAAKSACPGIIMPDEALCWMPLQDQVKDMVLQRVASVPAQDLPVLLLYLIKHATRADARKASTLPEDTHAAQGRTYAVTANLACACRWCR